MSASPNSVPGEPDSDLVAHERTYHGFNLLIRWCMTLLAAGLSFLTLWFATAAGFLGALGVGAVVFAACYAVLVKRQETRPLDPWSPT